MECAFISVAYVGILANPLPRIPQIDRHLCKDLLGDPYEVDYGISQDGLVISKGARPLPLLVIGNRRIVEKAETGAELLRYHEALSEELDKIGVDSSVSALGINFELQCMNLEAASEKWMSASFLSANLQGCGCLCTDLSVRVIVDEGQSVNMKFERRRGVHDGIFISANHHHNMGGMHKIDCSELKGYIESSEKIVEGLISRMTNG